LQFNYINCNLQIFNCTQTVNHFLVMLKKFNVALLSALLLSSAGCREKKEIVGPEYVVANTQLKVTTFAAAKSGVNFANKEQQHFIATLSDRVSWKITLRGQESNAVKVLEGLSDEINESNSSWNGVHDELRFFNNEKVLATLSFIGTDYSADTEFIIDAPVSYPEALKLGNGFEVGAWQGPWFDPGEQNLSTGVITHQSIQGRKAYLLKGTDLNNSYYLGVIRWAYKSELPENADEVYFNIYAYGTGDATSVLKLAGKEDENGNKTFDDKTEDAWEKEIPLGHKGWKFFSFKYSDFARSVSKNHGGNGNNIREPHKIVAVDIALQTSAPGSQAEAIVDFPVITVGKPFHPDNF